MHADVDVDDDATTTAAAVNDETNEKRNANIIEILIKVISGGRMRAPASNYCDDTYMCQHPGSRWDRCLRFLDYTDE